MCKENGPWAQFRFDNYLALQEVGAKKKKSI